MNDRLCRIAVYGPECSGKSTLSQQLATHFDAPWAPEFVRDFWHQRAGDIRASDLGAVAQGQIDNESAAAERARDLVICDTELITNTLWADVLFPGECPAWVRQAADERCRHYALYLFCDNDLPFVDDGLRVFDQEDDRRRCRDLWRQALLDRGIRFVDIHGPQAKRLALAVDAITPLLARPRPRP